MFKLLYNYFNKLNFRHLDHLNNKGLYHPSIWKIDLYQTFINMVQITIINSHL